MAPGNKSKPNTSGLGRAIMKKRVDDAKKQHHSLLHTTELPSGLNSVTQENDLEDFLNAAQLAGSDFTAEAERRNVTVLSPAASTSKNPYLLSRSEEQSLRSKQSQNRQQLRVPRRPPWTREMGKDRLETREREAFLEWRRGLADLTDQKNLLLTPFERNLQVWRQLWRTVERSHLVVQIVDARNPLGFRCEDLETYVHEVGETQEVKDARQNLLLVNKADLLTRRQRRSWAKFFASVGIDFAFFSALDAVKLQEQALKVEGIPVDPSRAPNEPSLDHGDSDWEDEEALHPTRELDGPLDEVDEGTARILTVEELESLFLSRRPKMQAFAREHADDPKFTVGLVGYPNVGKSSTINALVGAKKVSVSATPGKTKNFQTIHLSEDILLCDCPGLVFPQFATTKADLVCDGVLPIDQLREHTGPVALITRRIPRAVLEATYGLRMSREEGDADGSQVSVTALLSAYSVARGFFTSGQGNPDESRSSRYVLKDYVKGKLLYCHPPPGEDADVFNEEMRDIERLRLLDRVRHRKAPVTRVGRDATTYIHPSPETLSPGQEQSSRAQSFDRGFFRDAPATNGPKQTGLPLYPGQRMVGDDGRPLPEGHRVAIPPEMLSKKHFKGGKRMKQRSGHGYE